MHNRWKTDMDFMSKHIQEMQEMLLPLVSTEKIRAYFF